MTTRIHKNSKTKKRVMKPRYKKAIITKKMKLEANAMSKWMEERAKHNAITRAHREIIFGDYADALV